MRTADPSVVVVGGGVTGLLVAGLLSSSDTPVVLVEAGTRLGGQVHTMAHRGNVLDVGAEAIHLASPDVRELIDSLGLAPSMVRARQGPSLVATGRGLRPLPAGVTPGGPTRLGPVLRSGLLSIPASARAALEPAFARYGPPLRPGADMAVGRFVRSRFGAAAAAALVDPLLGNLHAGDVNQLSLRACAPALLPAAQQRRSMVGGALGWARRPATPSAGFASWPRGMTELIEALSRKARDRGARILTGEMVTAVHRDDAGGYLVHLANPEQTAHPERVAAERTLPAAQVLLAVPAHEARRLLQPLSPQASQALSYAPAASVASIVLGFPRTSALPTPFRGANGVLIASDQQRTIKAVTFLATKWPHLADSAEVLVRLSAGRYGGLDIGPFNDDELAAASVRDFAELTGLRADPTSVLVVRWPRAMPQQLVGHRERIDRARAVLQVDAPGVHLAGAGHDGVGLAACVTSAKDAARRVRAARRRQAPRAPAAASLSRP